MKKLKHLKFNHIRFPDNVKVLRKALNSLGYDASDLDIQLAYRQWSEDNWCSGKKNITQAVQNLIDEGYLK